MADPLQEFFLHLDQNSHLIYLNPIKMYSVIVALTGLPIGYSVIVALTALPIGYSVIVALTALPIGYNVIIALTGLPIGYSVIVALTGLSYRIQCNSSSNRSLL